MIVPNTKLKVSGLEELCLRYLVKARGLQLPESGPGRVEWIEASADMDARLIRKPISGALAWRALGIEAKLMAEAMGHGLGFAVPFGVSYLPFDLFVFSAARTYRVQVKYGSYLRGAGWVVKVHRSGGRRYKKGDFDILAAFSPNLYAALGLLLLRSALSQMDVPTRTSYVMAVVTPAERPAAASVTAVPRSLASAISPAISGALLMTAFSGLPLVVCGTLKIAYDLALLYSFRHIKPPEERG